MDNSPMVDEIARVCHEANRAFCLTLGDTSQPSWQEAPDWQRDSARAGVRLHLNHPETGPEGSHQAWMAQKLAEGWTYGPLKDPEAKTHPCIVEFDKLPPSQQMKDHLFRGIVHAFTFGPLEV